MKMGFIRFGFAAALVTCLFAKPASAELIVGLTNVNTLVRFDSANPANFGSQINITGTSGVIVAIDLRPATGELYGLDNNNNLYVINSATGAAAFASMVTGTNLSQFGGFDFNPTVDRLRIVDVNDNNLRVNVDTGATTVDGTLAYATGDANQGANPSIVGSAYSNNVSPAPMTTTLYGVDSNLNILVSQAPPNDGKLNTIGSLGINLTNFTGFDISRSGTAYLSTADNVSTNFYTVNLGTGATTLVGTAGVFLRDIAAVPEPTSIAMMGMGLAVCLAGYTRSRSKANAS